LTLETEVNALRAVPLFSAIDPKELKLLVFLSEEQVFHDGERLCQEGEEGDCAYVLLEGDALILVNFDGVDRCIRTLGPNQVFGEISIIRGIPRTASVEAKGEVRALRIESEIFMKLSREFPDMALEVMRELSKRLEVTTRELAQARAKAAAESEAA